MKVSGCYHVLRSCTLTPHLVPAGFDSFPCVHAQFLILDEPTTGLDPSARRETWALLRGVRAGRTVLLSTHSMEEAEAIADRIAIMADGTVRCYGSPLFLKNKYCEWTWGTCVLQAGQDVGSSIHGWVQQRSRILSSTTIFLQMKRLRRTTFSSLRFQNVQNWSLHRKMTSIRQGPWLDVSSVEPQFK